MKKKYVYIIIDGCVGDEAVYGVYSSKKRAEEEIKNNAKSIMTHI